ncbi:MAG: hypothetical protein A2W93_12180 [Bacteroidetes bacterium GWF2_43_63]|nr:MAG: hypothetical protein A2W94_15670 [Bacteroidetes bacterium GWE2_42_42]OFY56380.1 MAG: hypothetical protein A2W93_12180 [Bacteroidetes bacterium GWF2_43_63]HBG69654.1 hypothetical protein [Bacteroidales bacterium]HCB61920.1 hypothetical protein [Bacteroidales bacterium]HCY22146.1 hypothetical protein [Bacteroidales bacterium]
MKKTTKTTGNRKAKKKRNKKYMGAIVQSAKSKAQVEENNYRPAIDFLSGYNSNINSLSNQLSHLTSPIYQTSLLNAFCGIQDKLSSFNTFESMLPKFDQHNFISPALDFSRHATLAYSGLSTLDTVNNLASLVTPNYPSWYGETIAKSSFLTSPDFAGLDIFQSSKSLIEMFGSQNLSAFSVQSSLAKATEYSLYTEKSLANFSWADLGYKVGLDEVSKGLISSSFLELSMDYSELLRSFGTNPSSYIELSPSLTKLAPVELYTGANLLELLSADEEITTEEELLKNEIQYENEYSLNLYLPKVHSGLLNMWKGAIETFNTNNSDKVRQFTASLRELFTHVLHQLAPDDKVKTWTENPTFYDQGKPTRKARLHFICRNISNKPFDKFVEKNIQATLEFINIFQDGTHSIESGFTPQQLIAMKSKAETTLKFLLEIEFSTNRQ